jgi:hypothetical protein
LEKGEEPVIVHMDRECPILNKGLKEKSYLITQKKPESVPGHNVFYKLCEK